jgi:tetratricopeptide (TPR) repeat protein
MRVQKVMAILFLIYGLYVIPVKAETAKECTDKGNSFFDNGSYEKAIRCYDRALKIDAKHIDALIKKANALTYLEKYKESITCCDKALKIDSKNMDALYGICQALIFQNKDTECVKYFVKIVKIEPKNPLISGSIYPLLDQLGKYEVMLECSEKALEFNPKNMDYWYYIVLCPGKYGRF